MTRNPHPTSPPAGSTDLDFIERLLATGGPTRGEFERTDQWFQGIYGDYLAGRLDDAGITRVRTTFRDVLGPDTLTGHVLHTPRGYHGDFELIDRIYTRQMTSKPALIRWDEFGHWQPATQAVRNRKRYLRDLLHRLHAERPGQVMRMLNLGSGPGRDVAELADTEIIDNLHIDCLDQDEDAIAHAGKLCAGLPVEFIQANALRFRPRHSYDLIWSAGLFDYFSDRVAVALLKRFHKALKPGGRLVVGNFSPANPSRAYMETGEWMLIHRDPAQLRSLAIDAGIHATPHIEQEPLGINLFLHLSSQ